MKHALSIDVEDWFQVLNMAGQIDRADWDRQELRCEGSTRRILEILDRHQARATFFFLGWIAERMPNLVSEVRKAGHEIGSHGYDHRLLSDLGEAGFREDVTKTNRILTDITGSSPQVFRACTWSITERTPWAFDILSEEGFRLDSSVFPVWHPDYGVPGAPTTPYRVVGTRGELVEFPPLTWTVLGRQVPVGGGGYLRLLPLRFLRWGLAQQERRGWPGCVYLHPWEIDPEQPRKNLGGMRGFRHYVNLARTAGKLGALLQRYEFVSLSEAVESVAGKLRSDPPVALWESAASSVSREGSQDQTD